MLAMIHESLLRGIIKVERSGIQFGGLAGLRQKMRRNESIDERNFRFLS